MKKKIIPQNYDYLWIDHDVNFIFTSCYLFKSFKKADIVLIYDYRQKGLKFFLSKKTRENFSKYALKFYQNNFATWQKDILENIKIGEELIRETKKYQPAQMTLGEIKRHFKARVKLFQDLGDNYFYTEFFFLDKVEQSKNKKIIKNLKQAGKLKLQARGILNNFYNYQKIFAPYIKEVSKRAKRKDLEWLSWQDIIKIINQKSVPVSKLNKTNWLLAKKTNWQVVQGKQIIKSFDEYFFPKKTKIIKGQIANKGKARGRVKIIRTLFSDKIIQEIKKVKKGDILVAETTGPEMMPAIHLAAAIITDQGGITSHAAVVSRELNNPCIIGTKIATKILKDNDLVEVDADRGIIKTINK